MVADPSREQRFVHFELGPEREAAVGEQKPEIGEFVFPERPVEFQQDLDDAAESDVVKKSGKSVDFRNEADLSFLQISDRSREDDCIGRKLTICREDRYFSFFPVDFPDGLGQK